MNGFTKVGGDSYLTCSLSQNGDALWNGDFIKCNSKIGKYLCKYFKLHVASAKVKKNNKEIYTQHVLINLNAQYINTSILR